MFKLKRQIEQLEAGINVDKNALRVEAALLRQEMRSPLFLTTAIVGGFAFGFLMGNHTTSEKIHGKAANLQHYIGQGIKHFQFLLPLITRML